MDLSPSSLHYRDEPGQEYCLKLLVPVRLNASPPLSRPVAFDPRAIAAILFLILAVCAIA
jgi:hypothetical protein